MRAVLRRVVVGVVLSVAVLFGTSVPAHATDPVPGPVDEILDIPSRVARSATGSPIGDTVLMMLKGQRWAAGGGALVPVAPANVPKPITPPAAFSRAGGSVLTAALGAWAIGSNGSIALLGVATGTDYETVYCSQPDWYQATTAFVNMGFAPGCEGMIPGPNADQPAGAFVLSTGSFSVKTFTGPGSAFLKYTLGCGPQATLPAGERYDVTFSGGTTAPANWTSTYSGSAYCGGVIERYVAQITNPNASPSWQSVTSVKRVQSGTGTVLETAVQNTPNPTRTPRCKVYAGSDVFQASGTPYTETDGLPLSAAGLGCAQAYEDLVSSPGRGPGFVPDRIQVESETDGGVITEISDQEVPDFAPDEKKAFDTGNGRGLVLHKVTGVTTSSCMTWAADCSGWWEATDSGTSPTVGASTYRCTFAGQQIALAECGAYRYTFDTQTQTPTITDPSTGEQVGWSAQPTTGNSINPGTGPGTGLSPADACFETGWAEVANPVDWVLVPVKCALVWAFVPRGEVVDAAQGNIADAVDESVVGSVGDALSILGEAFDVGVGCGGLPFHLEAFGHTLVDAMLLESCTEPAAGIAATVRTILSVAIIGGGIMAFTRYLGSLFGFESFGRNRTEVKSGGPSFD